VTLRGAKSFAALLTLCFLLTGISLIWMDPNHINGDTLNYLAIANYYLYSPVVHVRDAFTVGPVIPALIAATKFVALKFVPWSPDVDIAVLKGLSFFCYVAMTLSAFRVMTRHIERKQAFLALFCLFGILGCVKDTLSLNGEMVASAALSVLMVVLQQQHRSPLRYVAAALLSIFVIYTKIQAIPLLFLLLVSESNSRRELAIILLYVFSATIIAEAFLYLNGVGLVNSFIYMYVYLSSGSVAGSISVGKSAGFYSGLAKYFQNLTWLLERTTADFAFVYIILALLLLGRVAPRKNLFSDWKVWLGVTIFTILAPGRDFEHYLMFLLPFAFRFAGPAVAGVRSTALSPAQWRYCQEGMAIILFLELAAAVPDLNPGDWNWAGAFPRVAIDQSVEGVRAMIKRNPGTVFVNGWDDRMYSFLNTYNTWGDLPLVTFGIISEQEYVNRMIGNRFDYLVDVTGYSGVLRDKRYALSSQGMEAAVVGRYYDLAFEKGGLVLYRRKTGQLPPYIPLGNPQRMTLSLVSSSLGCKDCFPDYPGIRKLPGEDKFGTYGKQGDPATGDFIVSYIPQGSVSEIKYTVGPNTGGLGIDIYNDCADGSRIKRSVYLEYAKVYAENDAYFSNAVCNTRRVELHFMDNGPGRRQWLGLLGVDGY